ncbi:TRADD-N-associated membrane domain-containing protein [Flavobacterium collinsii]|uniref:Cyanobacterial TRADD-N associated 2 transmembrane domain-containing protein n=1 Tax=Flavobacterium collinsii TaxID=1114861 RepID=A0A9W4X5R7_9FLAO|nr:hypothetical protein [Flavobacterium collinsii]CAI2766334.1 membrane protein of unknown function [Flavobacterium collinsii]
MEDQEHNSYFKDKLTELESALINAKSQLSTDTKNIRVYYAIVGLGTLFLILHYSSVLIMPTWLVITVWILTIFLLLAAFGTDVSKSKFEVEKFGTIKRIYLGFPDNDKPEYFDSLVKINVENLAAYYSLVKTHTSLSFKVSLLISIIGFILIISGLVIGFRYDDKIIGYIASGTGIVTEFISSVLFYLYNKTVRQLKEYHDSLINVQNILLSFKLIENTSDEKSKAEMVTKMLEYLVQKK